MLRLQFGFASCKQSLEKNLEKTYHMKNKHDTGKGTETAHGSIQQRQRDIETEVQ